ncbi:hypothetical protein RLOC_00001612 [Lonchura striata]|uniref:Reverse transcriptase/retrotransposon-derived protein RNase H-like domain-containing protein n=1 Tax=Lonchura striata TaxID=40157 RepID=A0A218UL05_9PASE|nr:hypothetical protein RLOC_00001612 [Lonchura striata domestica]
MHIPEYNQIVSLLYLVTHKKNDFHLGPVQQQAFAQIKQEIAHAVALGPVRTGPEALGFDVPGHSWNTFLTAALEESKAFLPCPQEMPFADGAAVLCPSSAHGLSLPVVTARTRSRTVTKLPEHCGLTATAGLARRGPQNWDPR